MHHRSLLILTLAVAACTASSDDPERVPTDPATTTPTSTSTDPPTESHVYTNRLAKESSPYLLQHAHNPVDWYPWGQEAFEKARKEDKPIFLSIGYSTCHWCHVMERESFENEEVAAILNANFVSVKVDREERPDVDAIYMAAVQIMGQRGGWPLSAFLTPDREPFFTGTYFPPEDRYGRPGFKTVLARITDAWKTRREEVVSGAKRVVDAIGAQSSAPPTSKLTPDVLARAVDQFEAAHDRARGGFGPPPKFPRSFGLSFLLLQVRRGDRDRILPMVERTLDGIALGGIHDHLGGGFHRYSTDGDWLVPHFEKMLYDQAFLSRAYLDAWLVTGRSTYADTARGVFDYVLRDLRDESGGFHSAEDADSEGVEGKFYVWTRAEILEILGEKDGRLFADVYRTKTSGNFLDEVTKRETGENILHLDRPLPEIAAERGEDPDALATRLRGLRDRLLAVRSRRVRPHLDDKVLTDWNGMMISSLAFGGAVLDEPRYVDAARGAAELLLGKMRTEDGLLHRYRKGSAGIDGFLDDYAFTVLGLTDLYQATFEVRWLEAARDLALQMVERFRDPDGTYRLARGNPADLVVPTKDLYDGASPSGNSAAALALVRVGRLTADEELLARGREVVEAWSGSLVRHPMSYPYSLTAFDALAGPSREIVIAGDPEADGTKALLAVARRHLRGDSVLLLHPPGDAGAAIRKLAPFLSGQGLVDGKPAAYVCENYVCQLPVTDPDALASLLVARPPALGDD